jgi:polyribonucleotide nucleotidyltransferase
MRHVESFQLGGETITLECGRLAPQAAGAVVVRHTRSFVLATVVAAPNPRTELGFAPLTVEYREQLAAGGRIPGNYFRREGKATEQEILIGRLIDRSLRPLVPDTWGCETQVQVTVLSADPASDLATLALLAACAAMHVSEVPWAGPVTGGRVSRSGTALQWWPRRANLQTDVEVVVAASRLGLVMVEGRANELPEAEVAATLQSAARDLQPALDALDRLRSVAGKTKRIASGFVPSAELLQQVGEVAASAVMAALDQPAKLPRRQAIAEAEKLGVAQLAERPEPEVRAAFEVLLHRTLRQRMLDGWRIGGRRHDEVRPIGGTVGVLAMCHGSALFERGETQALASCTLAESDAAQEHETVHGKHSERFLLHYNFPPFSVGEVKPLRGPGRREIGHGDLARRALAVVLPDEATFPYVIRVVSDILASNGSSSMATVCAGCLALMDAGVPIRAPVAGIAMGLVVDGERAAVLSDILGDEDHLGDMDFKVAGTSAGVTAVQLDNKLGSLPEAVLQLALAQAKTGRDHILGEMAKILAMPRDTVAAHAPQLGRVRIPPDKIGTVIGPGGATIKELEADTSCRIKLRKDGTGELVGESPDGLQRAMARIAELAGQDRPTVAEPTRAHGRREPAKPLVLYESYAAKVTGLKDYGAFVRVGDHESLVHVSELLDLAGLSVGDDLRVKVLGVDPKGRLQLSQKQAS